MRSRTYLILTLSALLLIHLLVFTIHLVRPPDPLPDSTEYLNASTNIYTRGTLYCGQLTEPIREELFTRRPPLYPLLLGVALLTGSTIPVLLLQSLFSLLSIYLIIIIFGTGIHTLGNTSGRFFPTRKTFYYLLLLLLIFTPAQFIYSNRIMTEIPFQLILVLMTWTIYRYFRVPEDGEQKAGAGIYVWLFYFLLSLGMAMKPVLFPFLIPAALYGVYSFIRTKKIVWILGLLIPLCWVTGYTIHNKQRTGSYQYSSIQTANLVNYNLRYFVMAEEGTNRAAETVDALYDKCRSAAEYADKNRCLSGGVKEMIMKEPFRYTWFHLKGSITYFLDPGRFDLVTFFSLSSPDSPGIMQAIHEDGLRGILRFLKSQGWGWILVLGLIGLFKVIKLTGLVIYLLRGRNELPFKIFLALLIGYLALVTGPLGASRFLLPVELLLIGASLKGWMMLLYGSENSPTDRESGKVLSDRVTG